MKINNISNSPFINDNLNKVTKKSEKTVQSDKIEISKDARLMLDKNKTNDLDSIKAKIDSNYYNQKSVIEKTAENILKELEKE